MPSVIDGQAMQQLFAGNEEEYDIPSGGRRHTRCSNCRELGHNIATCPKPEAQELMRQRRIRRIRASNASNPSNTITPLRGFKIYNDNTYPIGVYWYSKDDMTKKCRYLFTIDAMRHNSLNASTRHHIISFPKEELIHRFPAESEAPILPTCFMLASYTNMFVTGDTDIVALNESTEEIFYLKEYQIVKTEIDQWKECGLKSLFLLKEIERLGGKRIDSLEPIMDMVQDIVVPHHDELDKERAGIPSTFTNIT